MPAGVRSHPVPAGTRSEDFDMEILRRDGTYLVLARAFGVVVRNNDLQAGVDEALARISAANDLYREAGLEPQLSEDWRPRRVRYRGELDLRDRRFYTSRLMEYLLPALVSGVVLAGLVLLSSVPLFSAVARLNRTLEDLSAVTSSAMIEHFGHNAIEAFVRTGNAMDKVTPQRKEELRQAVHKIVSGLAPIIQEVGDSVERNPPTTPPAR
jgi:hypothetical protein